MKPLATPSERDQDRVDAHHDEHAHEVVVDELRQRPVDERQRRQIPASASAETGGAPAHSFTSCVRLQQPVRPEQQEGDEQREDDGVAIGRDGGGQEGDDEHLQRAEHVAAEQRPGDRAEAADDGRDEGLEQRREAHVGLDDPRLRRPEHAGEPGKAGGDGEGDDDQPVDVEPDQLRRAESSAAARMPSPAFGARHEPAEEGERHAGQHDRHAR